ncbi:MAG: amino acid adenylation domain-containing protein, partial [Actinomycetota bacterium]|nr:amino acid adenylation domain-containing protein [Actinomycetota bacterium]
MVAVAIERSVELLIAIWAAAKTGAGYLPIDPDYPADRIAHMLTDSGAEIGLTTTARRSALGESIDWYCLDAGDITDAVAAHASTALAPAESNGTPTIDNIAYVIYTSGSTGTPKGVQVTSRGLVAYAHAESRQFDVTPDSVVLGYASPSFDASILEWLLPLWSGATLVYRPADVVGGEPLAQFIREQHITHLFLTPSVLATLDPDAVPELRSVASGGEAVPQAMLDRWGARHGFFNAYGPTETTVAVSLSAALTPGQPITIGRPIHGVGMLVLDSRLNVVPVGVTGELYIAGGALARGYVRRPGLTADRFVADPFGRNGERLYRTGDLVRWRPGDAGELTLEYVGRSDDQVKLRGLRIELGEIEAVLAQHPAVESAVVVGVGGSVASALAGYVVLRDAVDTQELRTFVGQALPSHMVPASIAVLDALPLTPVGKLDKRALPEPVIETASEYVAPETEAQESVARVFAEVLGVDRVGATDSFFEVGGNSLSATRVAARVADVFGVDVSVRDVFEAPTVRALAAAVAGREAGLAPVTAVSPRPDRIPVSFAQQRMWFINQFDPSASTYNVPLLLRLTGALDVGALRSALVDVVVRHEVLRTTFPSVDGVPVQAIAPSDAVESTLDWAEVDSAAELEAAVTAGFEVTTQWPLRARLLRVADDEFVFAIVAHHIAADGESMAPLVGDLMAAYAARVTGAAPSFAPLEVQFADVALWQHRELGSVGDANSPVGQQLSYWVDKLDGLPDVLELPADRPRPVVASQRGAHVSFEVPADVVDAISAVAADRGVTPFMVVHAGLAVLLARLSATSDIAVGTPIAGRGQRALDALVGMFVNTLVLRADIDPGMTFEHLMDQVRATDLEAFAHADLPFETLVEQLDPVRSEAFAPLTQILLTFHQSTLPEFATALGDAFTGTGDIAGLSIAPVEAPETPAKVDLTVAIAGGTQGQAWPAQIVYATDLFDADTVRAMAQRFVRVLAACVADPQVRVGDVDLLADDELSALAALPAPVTDTVNTDRTLLDLFAATVATHGTRTAVTADGMSRSYADLDHRSDAVAAALAARGVRPGDLVGIATARSV